MLELGQSLGIFSALVLVVALSTFAKLRWSRAPRSLPHGRSAANVVRIEFASQILMLAVGLSVLAAFFAAVGWIQV